MKTISSAFLSRLFTKSRGVLAAALIALMLAPSFAYAQPAGPPPGSNIDATFNTVSTIDDVDVGGQITAGTGNNILTTVAGLLDITKLTAGTEGYILQIVSGIPAWVDADFVVTESDPLAVLKSTFTTVGDILLGTGSGTYARLGIGASGTVLKSNGTTAAWGTDLTDDTVSGAELDGVFSTTGLLTRTGDDTYDTVFDNSNDWDIAFGWGDHSVVGYLTSETDPTWSGSNTTTSDIYRTGDVSINAGSSASAALDVSTTGSELSGTAMSSAFRTNAGALGTSITNEVSLASIGYTTGNNAALGIRAYRMSAGTDWTTSAIGLGMDVDGTPRAGANMFLQANGNVAIGTTSAVNDKLYVAQSSTGYNAIRGYNTGTAISGESTTGNYYGVYGQNNAASGYGVYGRSDNGYGVAGYGTNSGSYGGYFTSTNGTGLYASSTNSYAALFNTGNVGIGTLTPSMGKLHVSATTGTSIYSSNSATNGTALSVSANAATGSTYGIQSEVNSTSGIAMYAGATASTGYTYGVYANNASASARGVYAVTGNTGSGGAVGVWGDVYGTDAIGVNGRSNSTTGTNYGIYGENNSPNGYAGFFYNSNASGYGLYANQNVQFPKFSNCNLDTDASGNLVCGSDAVGGSGTVTSVTAGNGMNFTEINGSGSVTMGTPSSLDGGTINSVSGTTHTHDISDVYVYNNGDTMSGSLTVSTATTSVTGSTSDTTGGYSGVNGTHTGASGISYGVSGTSYSTTGTGVLGTGSANSGTNYGVRGTTNSASGYGVFGKSNGTPEGYLGGASYGAYGQYNASNYGLLGANGAGVYGSGASYGVQAYASGTSAYGVFGSASSASGTNYGVWGQTASASGTGVYGTNSTSFNTGSLGTSTNGVYGYGASANTAVYGYNSNARYGGLAHASYGAYGNYNATTLGALGSYDSGLTQYRGVYGSATGTTSTQVGVYANGSTTSTNATRGLIANASSTSSGQAIAIIASASSTSGSSVGIDAWGGDGNYGGQIGSSSSKYGAYFYSLDGIGLYTTNDNGDYANLADYNNGYGVYGWGNNYGGYFQGYYGAYGSGTVDGVQGWTASTANGHGVFGGATGSTGTNYGVWGQTASASGYGVYGRSSTTTKYGYLGGTYAVYGQTTAGVAARFSGPRPIQIQNSTATTSNIDIFHQEGNATARTGEALCDLVGTSAVCLAHWTSAGVNTTCTTSQANSKALCAYVNIF